MAEAATMGATVSTTSQIAQPAPKKRGRKAKVVAANAA
jgi:hypothetical protein